MAFYGSSGGRVNSGYNLNDKLQEQPVNGIYDASVNGQDSHLDGREWNLNEKAEDTYHSDDEFTEAAHLNFGEYVTDRGTTTGRLGKWGSFTRKGGQSSSIHDTGFEVASIVNSSEDEKDDSKGHHDVPTYNMIGQDDRDEQSNLVRSVEPNHPIYSDSRLPPKSASGKQKQQMKRTKTRKRNVFDDDDNEDDYEEDEAEEDDPDDVDFEPEASETERPPDKDKFVEFEISDEEDELALELSDEDEIGLIDNRKHTKRSRAKQIQKPKGRKPNNNNLRKRGRSFIEDEVSSENYSDEQNDEVKHRSKRHQKFDNRSTTHIASTHSIDLSTSGRSSRSARKISYVESDESDESDAEKANNAKKVSKEDVGDDGEEKIDKVHWHQPKGMAEESRRNNQSTFPTVLSSAYDSDPQWDNMEFFIKWKGQSDIHNEWKSLSDLQCISGFKKVLCYMDRVSKDLKRKKSLSREEVEVHDVDKEMKLDMIKQYIQVERIFADRVTKCGTDDMVLEYLVLWKGLGYDESTWEKDTDIAFAQDAIDEYKAREIATSIQGKTVDLQRKKSRASLRKLDEQPEWLKGGKLRDYQLDGLNFLVNSWRNDTNVILADEMGLGKTIQSVSMLGFLQNVQQITGPFLVVVPLSTLANWVKEFKKWLPEMNVVTYIGSRTSREICRNYEFHTNKSARFIKFDALITTYELLLKDKDLLSKIKWNYMMVDEAHRLKFSEAKLYTSLLDFSTKNKLLITGTPLQNSVEELWALLHFLDPQKFNSKDMFVERYKNLSSFNEIELGNLHKELRPHILRRVIKDVEKSLPPKIERILRVEMSPLQRQYYKWILERNFQDLNKGVRGNQVSLLNIVVELKKCCNHPFLFESADHGYGGDSSTSDRSKVERIVMSSGKLVLLDKLLIRLRETNHRVLIFSQMVRMLDILADYLSLRGFQFQRLDGSTLEKLRRQAMDHFNAPGSEDFCFLLSTRAGGLGINLATADTVIIFDSDWNPQNDLQAMSRAHRIGQLETVNIYRFVTCKSVEEDILERAKKKMVLDHLVIQKLNAEERQKKETKKGGSMFDKNELSAILRFGAEELFKEDKNDEESKKRLESMDIDEILERAEKVETKGADTDEGNELLNAFKVANFSSAEDDTTFWSRLIQPEPAEPVHETLAPRAARNIKSYAEIDQGEKVANRTKRGSDPRDKTKKRAGKSVESLASYSLIEGASAQVRDWSFGNISKKDASRFVKAVKKFGNPSQISQIAAEAGGVIESATYDSQIELFDLLIDGCREAVRENIDLKATVLDFFGASVKASDLLARVEELQLLAKRIARYKDPVKQFRLIIQLKSPQWSRGCGWSQIDDARLLLGVYYHGYGNWEQIRLDTRLGLTKKIAPANLGERTFLPRSSHLETRASALLQKEFARASDKNSKVKGARRTVNADSENASGLKRGRQVDDSEQDMQLKEESRLKKMELLKRKMAEREAKEEGEISSPEPEVRYRQDKEQKWMSWCHDVLESEYQTLHRLERLQSTSLNLPKDKVLPRIKKYLAEIGKKIEEIVEQHGASYKKNRMSMRLWNYVALRSNLSGEKLQDIYSKIDQSEAGVGPSHNGNLESIMDQPLNEKRPQPYHSDLPGKNENTGNTVAWQRRRRIDSDSSFEPQSSLQRSNLANGNRIPEPGSSAGILGCGPAEAIPFESERTRSHGGRFLSGQRHLS